MTEIIKNFKFNFRYTIAFAALAGMLWILQSLLTNVIPSECKDAFLILSTIYAKDVVGRPFRALFPDKEEVKSSKAVTAP